MGDKAELSRDAQREGKIANALRYFEGDLTVAGVNFFRSHLKLIHFIGFVDGLAKRNDKIWETLDELLSDGTEENSFPIGQSQRELGQFRRLMAEVVLSRAIDSYLTYVSELLSLVFKERPETMRSKEQIPLDFILRFDSMEELQEAVAERRVERLAYRGMGELAGWVKETLGFALIPDRDQLKLVERLVEQRNLLVHHRGVIDHRYVRKVGSSDGAVGEMLKVKEGAKHAVTALAEVAGEADQRAAVKWGLERKPFPSPNS